MTIASCAEKNQSGVDELERQVLKAQKGDPVAFARIYSLTYHRLYRFCIHLTRDREHSRELAQEVFLRAFARIAGLQESQRFLSWLFVIARNLRRDELRARDAPPAPISEEDRLTPQTVLELQAVAEALPGDDWQLLTLLHIDGLTYERAAESLGLTIDLVRSRAHSARKRLIAQLRS